MWSRIEVGGGYQDEQGRRTRYKKIGKWAARKYRVADNLKGRPPRKITLEPKNKIEFLFRMDKTYYSILGLGDIQD